MGGMRGVGELHVSGGGSIIFSGGGNIPPCPPMVVGQRSNSDVNVLCALSVSTHYIKTHHRNRLISSKLLIEVAIFTRNIKIGISRIISGTLGAH